MTYNLEELMKRGIKSKRFEARAGNVLIAGLFARKCKRKSRLELILFYSTTIFYFSNSLILAR